MVKSAKTHGAGRLKGNIKADPARSERLAAAMRENLKRRKAKAKPREETARNPGAKPGPGET